MPAHRRASGSVRNARFQSHTFPSPLLVLLTWPGCGACASSSRRSITPTAAVPKLPMATWYLRREVAPLLDGGQLARGLIEVVALFRLNLGWMAYDAGQQDIATKSFTQALRLARAAGDRLLTGPILVAMSHQAIDLGQRRQAIGPHRPAGGSARTGSRHRDRSPAVWPRR